MSKYWLPPEWEKQSSVWLSWPHNKETYLTRKLNKGFLSFTNFYKKLLTLVVNRYWIVLAFVAVFAVFGYLTYLITPHDFIPAEDVGYFNAGVRFPPSSSLTYQKKYADMFNKVYAQVSGIKYYNNIYNLI